ncbi:MAG: signal transduction histidine kinase [Candidatus Azotimanducaceae bacterium]|jgi:signal transduction histidine kinase
MRFGIKPTSLFSYNIFLFFFFLGVSNPLMAEEPRVIDGIIDLRDWDFEIDGEVQLKGDWEFCWNQHLGSHQMCEKTSPSLNTTAKVPGYWNDIELFGDKLPAIGFATYRLDVLITNRDRLALKFLSVGTAYSLFIDGELVAEVGKLGRTEISTRPAYVPQIISFAPQSNRVQIILHVSNFHHRSAGLWEPVKLGQPGTLYQLRESDLSQNLMLVGAILIMALYNIATWFFRRENQSGLYLALFCFAIGARILFVGERYINELLPGLGWAFLTRMEYFFWMLSVPLFMSFMYSLYQKDISKIILQVAWGISGVFAISVLIVPIRTATELVPPFQLLTLLAIFYGIVIVGLTIYRRREGSILLGIGCAFLFLAAIKDMADTIFGLGGENTIHIGLFLFVLFQSLLVSIRSSKALQVIENQSSQLMKANMELQIQEKLRRTAEGQSIALHQKVDRSDQLKALGVIANVVAIDLSAEIRTTASIRANEVLKDIVSLIRDDQPSRDVVDLQIVIDNFLTGDEYQNLLLQHPKLDIITDIENASALIAGSGPHIQTLLITLIRYIAEVQPEDQVIIVSGRRTSIKAKSLFQHDLKAGEYYVLKIGDEGQGIDPIDLVNIFDPSEQASFYSGLNKRLRNLAAAWTILKNHDGAIDIYSVSGSTRLDLYFPLKV